MHPINLQPTLLVCAGPVGTTDVQGLLDLAYQITHTYTVSCHPPLENTKLLITPLGAIMVRARELTY